MTHMKNNASQSKFDYLLEKEAFEMCTYIWVDTAETHYSFNNFFAV